MPIISSVLRIIYLILRWEIQKSKKTAAFQ